MLRTRLPGFLTGLERRILQFILEEDSEENRILSDQLADCVLESRELNGYGFFSNFKVPEPAPHSARMNFELGDVSAVVSGQLCGFILFVREGKAAFLEGFPLGGDEWPSPENLEKVTRLHSC
jgi:hypothetical protein